MIFCASWRRATLTGRESEDIIFVVVFVVALDYFVHMSMTIMRVAGSVGMSSVSFFVFGQATTCDWP